MTTNDQTIQIHAAVQDHYRELALRSAEGSSCCGPSPSDKQATCNLLYPEQDLENLPASVTDISLGCGDPISLAALEPGQTVLDLGSGGGIDCFLASKKVGPQGKVIGVDMTQAMIDLATANQALVGAENVEFRLGQIESLPVEGSSVDVIISNCVINLSPDKPAVFAESFRVLKPGGKLAVSDIVTTGELPSQIKDSLSAWAGCVAGAWDVKDYVAAMGAAGFENITIEPTYWDDSFFDAAIENLEPALREQVQLNRENGKTSLLFDDGQGMKLIEVEGEEFDLQKSIFSARITAWKPL